MFELLKILRPRIALRDHLHLLRWWHFLRRLRHRALSFTCALRVEPRSTCCALSAVSTANGNDCQGAIRFALLTPLSKQPTRAQ